MRKGGFDSHYPLMLLNIFSKITRKNKVTESLERDEPVALYLLFPIAVAFLITFSGARLISHYTPDFFIRIIPGIRVHHYSYGFLVLAASGYLAMVNNRPRETYLISLLHGFGLGMAFDEFGIWLRLTDDSAARFSYDGVTILVGLFFLIISADAGIKAWRKHVLRKTLRNRSILASKEALDSPLTFESESDKIEG